uniref:Uncharacterized protein n=1 Tax=Setaria viridis TaxID=4556 RepID=A0A4U6UE68_SETVI|nr:hypothetical protein SEVIR_5G076650v2 [Setaria viridis]
MEEIIALHPLPPHVRTRVAPVLRRQRRRRPAICPMSCSSDRPLQLLPSRRPWCAVDPNRIIREAVGVPDRIDAAFELESPPVLLAD